MAWLTVRGKSRRNCPDRGKLSTGPSSGAGAATPRKLTELGAMVAAIARRKDHLDQLVGEIDNTGSAAPQIEADFTARLRVATAVQEAVERFGLLDMLGRVSFPAATRIFWASHLLTHN